MGTTFSILQRSITLFRILTIRLKGGGPVLLGKNIHIGRNCAIRCIYRLETGNNIYIGKNVTIECELKTGNDILVANNVGIVGRRDHDIRDKIPFFHAYHVTQRRDLSLPTVIGNNVWIGYGSIILSGVTIGSNVVIAAGAVVFDDIEDDSIVSGNPAKVVRRIARPQSSV